MMGLKERAFGPLPPLTLEELVPPDHFYRHLERSLDLSFVRDLVHGAYVDSGRPSIDPVVFFKLQLVLFFEGFRSERRLMQMVADREAITPFSGWLSGLWVVQIARQILQSSVDRHGCDGPPRPEFLG
jgi:hypothetical protein